MESGSKSYIQQSMNLRKIIIILPLIITLITSNVTAESECFEKTSRAIFKFNMAFDDAVLEPAAKGYNKLPEKNIYETL